MQKDLILPLFPGLDALGRGFEQEGYCVVRGPEIIWGRDIREFHAPAGIFAGVIGGPPCPEHSSLRPARHIVALSGGKDSAALALYLREKGQPVEYVFCDTGRELPEVYDFLGQLSERLGHIEHIQSWGRDFDWHLEKRGYYLPSPMARWCTNELKLRPFKRFLAGQPAVVYIGLRADEDRVGNYGLPNVEYRYPLREAGIDLAGVKAILRGAGLDLPGFYKWRSTGGCWCCPFQRKADWAGLKLFHPDLFARALEDERRSGSFTWRQGQSLKQVEAGWQQPLELDEWEYYTPCLICAK